MKIPNAEQAVVDIRKLRDYCLNLTHPRGKHKAFVFLTALGLSAHNADELRMILLSIVQKQDAVMPETDDYGCRYVIDFALTRRSRTATIRSCWIVRRDEDFPRLTSCYVL